MRLNELTIEITQECPNKCLFCSSLAVKHSEHIIPRKKTRDVASQARDLGLKNISVSGGEPLWHEDIVKIISDFSALGLHSTLYTTGIKRRENFTTEPFIEWQAFDKSATTLIFNIQSTDSVIHNELTRNKGSFECSMTALSSAVDMGFRTETHIVPNRVNLDSIERTVEDLASLGVDVISFLRLVPQGYARQNASVVCLGHDENESLKKLFEHLSGREYGKTRLRFGIPFSALLNGNKKCNAGETKLIIRYDGKVLPCEAFKECRDDEFVLGDIYKNDIPHILDHAKSFSKLINIKRNTDFQESCPVQCLHNQVALVS